SPDELAAMRRHARAHAENFSWEHTADALQESYSRAMASFAAAPGARVGPTGAARRASRRWRRRHRTNV
ncbi:D-inositol-3-phosphate glycosyltransferase, partial [Mycobacterium tuberculosis]|nr:D-inositol-3-phosphate glycosyltransferase [Mycobacterium tuberculosis]